MRSGDGRETAAEHLARLGVEEVDVLMVDRELDVGSRRHRSPRVEAGAEERPAVVCEQRRVVVRGRLVCRARRVRHEARRVDPSYLRRLVNACASGDAETARRLLKEHAAQVRALAREAIDRAGGTL